MLGDKRQPSLRGSSKPKVLDSICNRITLLAESNRMLGDELPQVYFGRLADQARRQGTPGGLQKRLEDSLIPGSVETTSFLDGLSLERFEVFCRMRADLIIRRVREIIGDSLNEGPVSDDLVVEEED